MIINNATCIIPVLPSLCCLPSYVQQMVKLCLTSLLSHFIEESLTLGQKDVRLVELHNLSIIQNLKKKKINDDKFT